MRALALLLAGDRERLRRGRRRRRCSTAARRRPGSPRKSGNSAVGLAARRGELLLGARTASAMNGLAASRPWATTSSVGGGDALVLDQGPGGVGGLGLDHHDRDVLAPSRGTTRPATTMSKTARSSSLCVGNATHWPSIRATRTPPIGPLNGSPASWVDIDARVDRDDVVQVVGVERHDGDDDLDLVAQALDEGRAQRAVDQPAGEDRVGRRAALAAEERAGDAARGVHPLLDVDRQREEVELVLRVLAGGRRRQQHRVVVEVGDGRAGGLLGEPPGLEPDRAGAEAAVVDDGFGGT